MSQQDFFSSDSQKASVRTIAFTLQLKADELPGKLPETTRVLDNSYGSDTYGYDLMIHPFTVRLDNVVKALQENDADVLFEHAFYNSDELEYLFDALEAAQLQLTTVYLPSEKRSLQRQAEFDKMLSTHSRWMDYDPREIDAGNATFNAMVPAIKSWLEKRGVAIREV